MKLSVTRSQARKFLLEKQLLLPPQKLRGNTAIETVFHSLRLVQYDPLNPCGRNVDLVLQARISDYHPDAYQHWLYTQKKGIECYDKELCIIPIEDFALTHIRRVVAQKREDKKVFLTTYKQQIERLLQQIAAQGPITSSDIRDKTRVQSGWGTDALFGRIALETLWKMGRLVIVKRDQGKKYYDLPQRVHSSLVQEVVNDSLTKEHVKRRLRSVGLLPVSGRGGGWQGLGPVRPLINQLVNEGEFLEVHVDGCLRSYVIATSDEELMKTNHTLHEKKLVFIAPLDNLLWDREMILDLFSFHYRWEVYTPVLKRTYGYYVLPILYGDRFIGRIEPVLTKEHTLTIRGFWQEDQKLWDKQVWAAFSKGVETFATYLRATTMSNIPTPGS